MKIIYINADRVANLSIRFPTKIILHFYSIHWSCSTYTTKGDQRQKFPPSEWSGS